MPDRPQKHPGRRRLRLSVRGFMLLTLLIAVWLGSIVRDVQIQRDAVKAIKRACRHRPLRLGVA